MSKSSMRSKIDTLKSWMQGRKPVEVKHTPQNNGPVMNEMPRFIKGMKR